MTEGCIYTLGKSNNGMVDLQPVYDESHDFHQSLHDFQSL